MKRSGSNVSVDLSLANYSQSDNRNVDAVLYFIIPKGLTEDTCSLKLQSAKKLCEDYAFHTQWVEEANVKKMKPKKHNIFILDPFGGPAYEFLENLVQNSKDILVIGPQCIHYALNPKNTNSTIESRGYPFYTMGMRDICITFTGFKPDEQKELTNMVQKMNGIVSKPFSTAITHVVAQHVLTPKCKEAFKNEVPVMSAAWVQQVWKDSQEEVVDATHNKYIVHTCGIFHNINICVSQVPSALKNTIEKIIKAGGGVYTKDFRRNVTQVLVVPMASGEKYKFAEQWGVPSVTPDWVHKSKESGHVVSVDEFKPPRRPIYNSTQISEDIEPQIPDFSNLTGLSAFGETADASRADVVNASRFTNCSVLTTQESDIRKTDLDSLRQMPDDVLNGCKIYLCQCESPRMAELRLILLERGIDCCSEFSDTVTHIVTINGNISDKELAFKRADKRLRVVPFEWLVQCALKAQHLDESSYELEVQQMIQNRTAKNKESLRQELNESLGLLESNQRNANGASSTTGRSSGDKFQRNTSQSAFVQPECVQRAKSISQAKDDSETFKEAELSVAVPEEAFVFSGFKFAVQLETPEECSRIAALIKESSGVVLEDKDLSSSEEFISVLPPVYERPKIKPWQSFTKYWVTEVIEEKSLEIPEKFYHLPLEANSDLKDLLNGVVLAISAYPSQIKEYITKVALHLGAKVQEVFSRKDTKGSLKSTHLICGVTDNDKYRAAQRWGTPVVSCEWIISCFERKELLDHLEFSLQTDNSDMTVNMLMKTPNTQAEKNHWAKMYTKSNQSANCALPATDKSKMDVFQRPQVRNLGKLNFDGENEMKAQQSEAPTSSKPLFKNPSASEAPESPIITGMTRSGSRQLKRAIDWALMDSPVSKRATRRKSTPISEVMKGFHEALAKTAEERRIELNVSPVCGWVYKDTKNKNESPPEKSESPNVGVSEMAVNLLKEFEDIENEENGPVDQENANLKLDGNDPTLTNVSKSIRQASKASNLSSGSSGKISTRSKGPQPSESKFDYMDDFVAGIHDDGEEAEIEWRAEEGAKVKPPEKNSSADVPQILPESVDKSEKLANVESHVDIDVVTLENNKNVKKKRGTGSSVHSYKSSISSTGSTSGKITRSKRHQEPADVKTLCFATSGGTAADKEKYQSILSKLGATISTVEHYDPNADAVVASKVARSEKILGSIAAGKPLLHPSYINACLEAGRLIEFDDYLWKESHCNSNSEKMMTQVAQFWYQRRKENPNAGPYSNFIARIIEDKSATKRNAYIRLIEAGGGKVVGDDEDPNIVISDGRSGKVDFPSHVFVKVPMFLNDVIIHFDDESFRILG